MLSDKLIVLSHNTQSNYFLWQLPSNTWRGELLCNPTPHWSKSHCIQAAVVTGKANLRGSAQEVTLLLLWHTQVRMSHILREQFYWFDLIIGKTVTTVLFLELLYHLQLALSKVLQGETFQTNWKIDLLIVSNPQLWVKLRDCDMEPFLWTDLHEDSPLNRPCCPACTKDKLLIKKNWLHKLIWSKSNVYACTAGKILSFSIFIFLTKEKLLH